MRIRALILSASLLITGLLGTTGTAPTAEVTSAVTVSASDVVVPVANVVPSVENVKSAPTPCGRTKYCIATGMRYQLTSRGVTKARSSSNDLLYAVWEHLCFNAGNPSSPEVNTFLTQPDFSAITPATQAAYRVGCWR